MWVKKANVSELLMTCRNGIKTSEPGSSQTPGMSLAGACRLARWCPAWRWRELGLGFGVERVNLSSCARAAASGAGVACGRCVEGRPPSGRIREGLSTDAGHRGGPPRGSCEAW